MQSFWFDSQEKQHLPKLRVIDYCVYFETIHNIFWALGICLPEQP